MRRSKTGKGRQVLARLNSSATPPARRPRNSVPWAPQYMRAGLVMLIGLSFLLVAPLETSPAAAASPLNVFVGYFDTHSVPFSSNQPNPWPYTDPSSFDGTPCRNYPNDTTCWDAGAIRLDNPGSTDVTGVKVAVTIGSKTYALWGASQTVKAHGMLVLTETGSSQNSENFDGSDEPPNSYNGGNTASCVDSGAIPNVQVTIAGATTSYLDTGQVLNTAGVDIAHCLNGKFVSGRMDESHPWVQIGTSSVTPPSAPQSLAATAGSGSVTLTWAAPTSNGGAAITGYNVYRGTSAGGEAATPLATNVATTSFTDSGLVNGTTYYYTVAAVNSAGISPKSNEASATPVLVQATVPSAPQSLVATSGNDSAGLSWSAPASTGGSPITGYDVYRGTSPGGESATPLATNVSATNYTDTSALNGTTYYYTVAAINAVGVSPQSNEASATPQASVPSAPTGLVASGGNGSVVLSWAVPASDGNSPITGYDVYRGTSPGGESATPLATNVATTGFTDTTVVNGTTYYYQVAAVNGVGVSPRSGEASATPSQPATVPSAPQGLTAAGGNGTVSLSWSAPANNGGAAVNGYDVYRGTSAGAESGTPVATNVTGTTFIDTGLLNGTTYYYTVTALNAVGMSPQSGEASATPQATAPSAPLALVAGAGNALVNVSWSAPASNGGSPITGYNVYRGTSPGAESGTPVATNVTGTTFTDTGLLNGTTYYYTVTALNAVGMSPQSGEASATPQAPSAAAFVRRVGSVTASTSRTTSTVPVGAPGVVAGHTLVVSLLLSTTNSLTGPVSATDSAGNTYVVARDNNDGSAGDRTVALVSVGVKALTAGATITLTYPSSNETHVSVDEFSGVTGIDTSAGATGTSSAFSSGNAPGTSQAADVLIGTVGTESGKAPTWATGWAALPVLAVSSDYLGTAYQFATAAGAYAASGTIGGQWMASIITLKTS
jgi:fibronectin type 3 domain-containing protein